MYINYDSTCMIIAEGELDELINNFDRLDSTADRPAIQNKFTINMRPQGIIVYDSYNNPFFPIRPRPRIDDAKMNLFEVYRRTRELYEAFAPIILPWHYIIEFINDRYFVFATRPIDMKFPASNQDVTDDRQKFWDDATKDFMKDNLFDIRECIHILILGDSNIDVYTKKFYELLGRICVVPFVRYFKLPEGIGQRIFYLNMGIKFHGQLIMKFIRR